MREPTWIAFYGSLMRGLPEPGDTPSTDLLDRLGVGHGLRRIGPCRMRGVLVDLGAHPALGPAREANDLVRGELHALVDPGILATLDAFEGYDPERPGESDYLRRVVDLVEPVGARAWVYLYNRDPGAAPRVHDGDWRRHLAKRLASAHDPDSRSE